MRMNAKQAKKQADKASRELDWVYSNIHKASTTGGVSTIISFPNEKYADMARDSLWDLGYEVSSVAVSGETSLGHSYYDHGTIVNLHISWEDA